MTSGMNGTENNAKEDMIVRTAMPAFLRLPRRAITPYLHADDPSLPAYTAEDARAYVANMLWTFSQATTLSEASW
jgi:hypothetical protein